RAAEALPSPPARRSSDRDNLRGAAAESAESRRAIERVDRAPRCTDALRIDIVAIRTVRIDVDLHATDARAFGHPSEERRRHFGQDRERTRLNSSHVNSSQ